MDYRLLADCALIVGYASFLLWLVQNRKKQDQKMMDQMKAQSQDFHERLVAASNIPRCVESRVLADELVAICELKRDHDGFHVGRVSWPVKKTPPPPPLATKTAGEKWRTP